MAVPCGLTDGLPIGVQLIAAPNLEQFLLDISERLSETL
jgi:Asp-tRNA(Asn)/Glu-tRNA(Gln) amidotransferase A subunit family amidase